MYWLAAIRHQAITWANVDPDLCRHMASLAHNDLTLYEIISFEERYSLIYIFYYFS